MNTRGEMNANRMVGKIVLVTGGTSGIGRATALGLARLGAHLAVTGWDRGRTEDAARAIHAASSGPGGEATGASNQAGVQRWQAPARAAWSARGSVWYDTTEEGDQTHPPLGDHALGAPHPNQSRPGACAPGP